MAGEGTSTYMPHSTARPNWRAPAPSPPGPRRLFFFQFSRAERTSNSLILFRDFKVLKQYDM